MATTKKIYATLITSDAYSMGVEALIYSLFKVRASFPIVVLYSPQVTQSTVDKLARFCVPFQSHMEVCFRCVPEIGIPESVTDIASVHVPGWVNSGYTKLNIFAMEEYEQIVYIDADALVLESVDEVFS